MKPLSAGMLAHVALGMHTLAWGMRVERADGNVTGWTSHDAAKTVTVNGSPITLEPTNAINISSIVREIGLGVPTLEVSVIEFDDVMTRADLLDGVWDGAKVNIFQFNWADTSHGLIHWYAGRFGNITPRQGSFTIELRGISQAFQNDSTRLTQADCDYRFGDPATCTVNVAPHTYTGSVTGVTSNRVFGISLLNPDDAFTEGDITWTTGLNIGKRRKVMKHQAQTVTLAEAAVRTIQVGDTFTIIRGCMRRRVDCISFGNVLNFPGMDLKPTRDNLAKGEEA